MTLSFNHMPDILAQSLPHTRLVDELLADRAVGTGLQRLQIEQHRTDENVGTCSTLPRDGCRTMTISGGQGRSILACRCLPRREHDCTGISPNTTYWVIKQFPLSRKRLRKPDVLIFFPRSLPTSPTRPQQDKPRIKPRRHESVSCASESSHPHRSPHQKKKKTPNAPRLKTLTEACESCPVSSDIMTCAPGDETRKKKDLCRGPHGDAVRVLPSPHRHTANRSNHGLR